MTLDGTTLTQGTDYTVSYLANKDAGTATVKVYGAGDYTGSVSTTFTIIPLDLSKVEFKSIEDQPWLGKAVTPSDSIYYKDSNNEYIYWRTYYRNLNYTYEDNTQVGTAKMILTNSTWGTQNCTGTATLTFNIVDADISKTNYEDVFITQGDASYAYTGSEISLEKKGSLRFGEQTLSEGADYTITYSNNINVGTATATITGKGSYHGIAKIEFTIQPRELSDASLVLDGKYYNWEGRYNFTGAAIEPAITTPSYSGFVLTSDDYTVTYSNNTEVGTAIAHVVGKRNYTGTVDLTFYIRQADLSTATITAIPDQTYTGSAITPAVEVKLGENTLVLGKDYRVTYSNNVAAGTATAHIEGINNCYGSQDVTFNIVATGTGDGTDIGFATVSDIEEQTYNFDNSIKPEVTLTLGGTTLEQGVDYTVSYENNTEVGTATAHFFGVGEYKGAIDKSFTIKPLNVSTLNITIADQPFLGDAVEPRVIYRSTTAEGTYSYVDFTNLTYRDESGQWVSPVSYANNIGIGTATATISFPDSGTNFKGEKTVNFKIVSSDLSNADLQGQLGESSATYRYDSLPQTPFSSGFSYGDQQLYAGRDYTVTYKNNVDVGTATAAIKGIGSYSGQVEVTFEIKPTPLVAKGIDFDLYLDGIYSNFGSELELAYTGKACTPVFTGNAIFASGIQALTSNDYTVEYLDNVNVGTATVRITGKGNFCGTCDLTFKITAPDLADATIAAIPDQTYTGSHISPTLTVTLGGRTLVAGTDYKAVYTNNLAAGNASVVLIGVGNYTGYAFADFKIVGGTSGGGSSSGGSSSGGSTGGGTSVPTTRSSISDATIAAISDQTYTGKALTPSLTVKLGSKTLVQGTDYSVAYVDNTKVGTAKVIVAGIGSYEGVAVAEFQIVGGKEDPGAPSGSAFPDLEAGAWYLDPVTIAGESTTYIDYVNSKGLITGYANGNFGPNDDLSRAQVATILYRAANGEEANNQVASGFADVATGQWYTGAVQWAREQGIVQGYGDGSFGPDDSVTREQLAKMLAECARVKGASITASEAVLSTYADASLVDEWARPYLAWCIEQGIMSGYTSGGASYLNPQGTATRAEAAKMVALFYSKL